MRRPIIFGIVSMAIFVFSLIGATGATAVELPRSLEAGLEIELVASEPDIVTPVACRFDDRGRLFVIESHTHFPPSDYDGPAHDRIKILDDTDGDSSLDRIRVFHEGTRKTMGLAFGSDGWLYVATRDSIRRIRDTDGDDRGDAEEVIVRLETEADYPHNGLCGLAFDPAGQLTFGLGENFGEAYTVIGADGSSLSGGGEGGNIYRCTADGGNLHWIATGFWNPFGLAYDPIGRLLAVGNDPDARPPCRILHVVETGDYGFQFRFGRAGTNPLQSWDGELPGTLPMVAGTGEAPSAILPYRGSLWVTSWGDNRIERYRVDSKGASISAKPTVAIVGDTSFRPVDMAVAPDGSIYVTDWVDRSYSVHGQGRIWRIKVDTSKVPEISIPELSPAERSARRVADPTRDVTLSTRVAALDSDDPFVWQAAISGLFNSGQFVELNPDALESGRQRLGWLYAWRWDELLSGGEGENPSRARRLRRALADNDPDVRRFAMRWIAERQLGEFATLLQDQLASDGLTPAELATTAATLARLEASDDRPGVGDAAVHRQLASVALDAQRAPSLRAAAVALLGPDSDALPTERLIELATADDAELGGIATRHLAATATGDPRRADAAVEIATDRRWPDSRRADALVALSGAVDSHRDVLAELASDTAPQTATTAERLLRTPSERPATESKPLQEWLASVGDGGDPRAGWRVFFSSTARCATCHAHAGRGEDVGPDLTATGGRMTRGKILESILHPSGEMAPMYVPWKVLTRDGRALIGMKLNVGSGGNVFRYLAADGSIFEIPLGEVESQEPSSESIMPTGLLDTLSEAEVKDLLAFLSAS